LLAQEPLHGLHLRAHAAAVRSDCLLCRLLVAHYRSFGAFLFLGSCAVGRLLLLLLLLVQGLLERLHQCWHLPPHARRGLPRRLCLAAPLDLILLAGAAWSLADGHHALRAGGGCLLWLC